MIPVVMKLMRQTLSKILTFLTQLLKFFSGVCFVVSLIFFVSLSAWSQQDDLFDSCRTILSENSQIIEFTKYLEQIPLAKRSQNPRLQGQWAFVTGATSGIGLNTAYALAAEGSHVFITGRRGSRLNLVKKDLESKFGIQVVALAFDVGDGAAWRNVVEMHNENLQKVSMLVVNAGSANGLDPLGELQTQNVQAMINANILGVTLTLNYMTPYVKTFALNRQYGAPEPTILTVGSIVGRMPTPGNSVYSATKAFIHSITDALRIELGSEQVRVTLAVPGMVETEFSVVRSGGDVAQAPSIYAGVTPLSLVDVADQIVDVLALPLNRMIPEIQIHPSAQANSFNISRASIQKARSSDSTDIVGFISEERVRMGIDKDMTADGQPMYDDLRNFARFYEQNHGEFFVMRRGTEIIGTIGYLMHERPVCELKKFYMKGSQRGQGYGQMLLDTLFSEAKSNGCNKIVLQTRRSMTAALDIYKRSHFRESGISTDSDSIWLTREL